MTKTSPELYGMTWWWAAVKRPYVFSRCPRRLDIHEWMCSSRVRGMSHIPAYTTTAVWKTSNRSAVTRACEKRGVGQEQLLLYEDATTAIWRCNYCCMKMQLLLYEDATTAIWRCDYCYMKMQLLLYEDATTARWRCNYCYMKMQLLLYEDATTAIWRCNYCYMKMQLLLDEDATTAVWRCNYCCMKMQLLLYEDATTARCYFS